MPVAAVLDHALELGDAGVTNGSESAAAQILGLGLDSSVVTTAFGLAGSGGADTDGSESTTVTLTLNAALPVGATLSSTAPGASIVGGPTVFTITGDLEAIIDGLQVTVPAGYEGVISGTVSTSSTEANTPQGAAMASGLEPDVNDNTASDSVALDRKSTRLNSSH